MKLYASMLSIAVSSSLLFLNLAGDGAPKRNRYYYEKRGEVVWEVPTNDKVIALSFDDGPDPENTPQLLDILKQYDAKATFFLIGYKVEKNADIAKREAEEGHELANHTYSHHYATRRSSASNLDADMGKAEEAIMNATGQRCKLFRPPGGFYSDNLINAAKNRGYTVVMWSWHQDTKDWDRPGVDKIVSKVLDHSRNGDIVLFHDYVKGGSQTIEALSRILPELQQRGYRFVTISELLKHRSSRPAKSDEETGEDFE